MHKRDGTDILYIMIFRAPSQNGLFYGYLSAWIVPACGSRHRNLAVESNAEL